MQHLVWKCLLQGPQPTGQGLGGSPVGVPPTPGMQGCPTAPRARAPACGPHPNPLCPAPLHSSTGSGVLSLACCEGPAASFGLGCPGTGCRQISPRILLSPALHLPSRGALPHSPWPTLSTAIGGGGMGGMGDEEGLGGMADG
mmetsp:Transcript_81650/g.143999  ORF Transcript_81650/g.143999 Transcript_81650/m.143999 type:complete len:143 (-) Transcript_81650:142-570(-)